MRKKHRPKPKKAVRSGRKVRILAVLTAFLLVLSSPGMAALGGIQAGGTPESAQKSVQAAEAKTTQEETSDKTEAAQKSVQAAEAKTTQEETSDKTEAAQKSGQAAEAKTTQEETSDKTEAAQKSGQSAEAKTTQEETSDKTEAAQKSGQSAEAKTAQEDKEEKTDKTEATRESGQTSEPESGQAAAQNQDERSDDGNGSSGHETLTLTGKDPNSEYNVSLAYGEEAELPDEAVLSVTPFSEDSSEYRDAREKIVESRKETDPDFDEESLSLKVFDLSILDQNETETEPENGAGVTVSIQMNTLPDGVKDGDSLTIVHLAKRNERNESRTSAKSVRKALKSAAKADTKGQTDTYVETVATVTAENGKAEARFQVSSFSVFGIIGTKDDAQGHVVRRTYTFLNDDDSAYTFTLNANPAGGSGADVSSNTQTVKNGDTLKDVGVPKPLLDSNSDGTADSYGKKFIGWEVTAISSNVSGLSVGDTLTLPAAVSGIHEYDTSNGAVNADEAVTLRAKFGTEVKIYFHKAPDSGNADGVIVRTISAEPGSTVNLNSYYADTNVIENGRTLTFFGWTDIQGSDNVLDSTYTVPDTDVDMYPVYRYGYWLNFNKNDDDGDPTEAAYTQSVFVGNAAVTWEDEPADPTREGYYFGGWYTDSACTQQFYFYHTTLPGNTTVYARWIPAETTYSVIFWLQNANDDEYSYTGEVTESGTTGEYTNYSVSYYDLPDDITDIYDYLELNTNINQQRIYGDGSTTVNVYYNRKTYTLRFYYAYSTGSGSNRSYHVHTETSNYSNAAAGSSDETALAAQAGQRQASVNTLPTPVGYTNTGSTTVYVSSRWSYTVYTYYYFDISGKYGQNMESIWPAQPFTFTFISYNATYSFISWATRNGSGYYASNTNKNIKGIYSTLDSSLIIDPSETIAQSFLAYWNHPASYEYLIYYSLLYGETADITYNNVGYKFQNTYTVGSSADWRGQNALIFEGVDPVSDLPIVHGNAGVLGGEVSFAYQRRMHTITFQTVTNNQIAVDTDIPYGEDLSNENAVSRHEAEAAALAPENEEFSGWYDNQACEGDSFSFTGTMPDSDLVLYAKYERKTWTATFNANGGSFVSGQTSTASVANGDTLSALETTLNQTTREGYELVGWFLQTVEDGTIHEELYNFSDPVTSDITLAAHWRHEGTYQVRYVDFDGALLKADLASYADQSEVTVLSYPDDAEPPDGQEFAGWQTPAAENRTDGTTATVTVIYKPGETFTLDASYADESNFITMTAFYPELGTTYIRYDANGGSGTLTDLGYTARGDPVTDNIQRDIPENGEAQLSFGEGFSRTGYKFVGWNTLADADGSSAYAATRYQPGDTYGVDDTGGNTLYAEWARIYVEVSFTKKGAQPDGSKAQALEGAEFTLTMTDGNETGAVTETKTAISDENGLVVFTGQSAIPMPAAAGGSITLTETTAPDGYALPGSTWTVSCSSDPDDAAPGEDGRYYITGTIYESSLSSGEGGEAKKEVSEITDPLKNLIKIKKTDKADTAKTLSGAVFRIYRISEGNLQYYQSTSAWNEPAFDSSGNSEAGAMTWTTDENGEAVIGLLTEGDYYLEEIRAPDGYNRAPAIAFSVAADGKAVIPDAESYAEASYENPYTTIRVSNQAGNPLPSAGGSGFGMSPLYLAGLILFTLMGGSVTYFACGKGGQ